MKSLRNWVAFLLAIMVTTPAVAQTCWLCATEDGEAVCQQPRTWLDYDLASLDCEETERCIFFGLYCWQECNVGTTSCLGGIAGVSCDEEWSGTAVPQTEVGESDTADACFETGAAF